MAIDLNQDKGGRMMTAQDLLDDGSTVRVNVTKDGNIELGGMGRSVDRYFDTDSSALRKLDHWDDLPELTNTKEAIDMWDAKKTVLYTGHTDGLYTRGARYQVKPDGASTWSMLHQSIEIDALRCPYQSAADIKAGDKIVFEDAQGEVKGYILCIPDTEVSNIIVLVEGNDPATAIADSNYTIIYRFNVDTNFWTRTSNCAAYLTLFDKCHVSEMVGKFGVMFATHDTDKGTPFKWSVVTDVMRIPLYPYDTVNQENNTCYLNPNAACFFFGDIPYALHEITITVDVTNLPDGLFAGGNVIYFAVAHALDLHIDCVKNGKHLRVLKSGPAITAAGKYKIIVEYLASGELVAIVSCQTDIHKQEEADDTYYYGFRYDLSSSSPAVQRIVMTRGYDANGNPTEVITQVANFDKMPCHEWRRCVKRGDKDTPEYYLYPTDSRFKEDGITPADLTGKDGDVVVEIPKCYLRITKPEAPASATSDGMEYSGYLDYIVSRTPIPDPPKDINGEYTTCYRLISNGVHPLFGIGGAPAVDENGKIKYEQRYTYDDKTFFGETYPENSFFNSRLMEREPVDKVYAAAFASVACHYQADATTATMKATAVLNTDKVTPTSSMTFEGGNNYPKRQIGFAIGGTGSSGMNRSIAPYKDGDMVGVVLPGAKVIVSSDIARHMLTVTGAGMPIVNGDYYHASGEPGTQTAVYVKGHCKILHSGSFWWIINEDDPRTYMYHSSSTNAYPTDGWQSGMAISFGDAPAPTVTVTIPPEEPGRDPLDCPSLMPGGCNKVFMCENEGDPDDVAPQTAFEYTSTMSFVNDEGVGYYKDYHLKYSELRTRWELTDGHDLIAHSNVIDAESFTSFNDLTWTIDDTTEGVVTTMTVVDDRAKLYIGPSHYGNRGGGTSSKADMDTAMVGNPNWALNYRPSVSVTRSNFQLSHRCAIEYRDLNNTGVEQRIDNGVLEDLLVDFTGYSWNNKLFSFPNGKTQSLFKACPFDTPAYSTNTDLMDPKSYVESGSTGSMYMYYLKNDGTWQWTSVTVAYLTTGETDIYNRKWAYNTVGYEYIKDTDTRLVGGQPVGELYPNQWRCVIYGQNDRTSISYVAEDCAVNFSGATTLRKICEAPYVQSAVAISSIASANERAFASVSYTYKGTQETAVHSRIWTNGVKRIEYITPTDNRLAPNGKTLGELYPDEWRIIEYTDNTYTEVSYVQYRSCAPAAVNTTPDWAIYYAVNNDGSINRNMYIRHARGAAHTYNTSKVWELVKADAEGNETVYANADLTGLSTSKDTWAASAMTQRFIDPYKRYLNLGDTGFYGKNTLEVNGPYGIPINVTFTCNDTNTDPRARIWTYQDPNGEIYRLDYNYGSMRYQITTLSDPDRVLYQSNRQNPVTINWGNKGFYDIQSSMREWFHDRWMFREPIGLLDGIATGGTTISFTEDDTTLPLYDRTWSATSGSHYLRREYIKSTDTRMLDGVSLAYLYGECWCIVDYSDAEHTTPVAVVASDLDILMQGYRTANNSTYYSHLLFRPMNPEARDNQLIYNAETGKLINNTLVYQCKGVGGVNASGVFALTFFVDADGNLPIYLNSYLSEEVRASIISQTVTYKNRWVMFRFTDNTFSAISAFGCYSGVVSDQGPWDGRITYQAGRFTDFFDNSRCLKVRNEQMINTSLVSHRAYNCHTRLKQFFCLMMVIDGGTFDTQTGISTGKSWLSTFDYSRSTFCGRTVPLGNITGDVIWDPDVDINIAFGDWTTDAQTDGKKRVVAFNWRGFENPFGNIGEYEDGIIPCTKFMNGVEVPGYNESNMMGTFSDSMNQWNVHIVYPTYNSNGNNAATAKFSEYYPASSYWWRDHAFPASGWIRRWDPVTFLPTRAGGAASATTYCCDNYFRLYNSGHSELNNFHLKSQRVIRKFPYYSIHYESAGLVVSNHQYYENNQFFESIGTRLQF